MEEVKWDPPPKDDFFPTTQTCLKKRVFKHFHGITCRTRGPPAQASLGYLSEGVETDCHTATALLPPGT